MKPTAFNHLLEMDVPGRRNSPGKVDRDIVTDRFIKLATARGFKPLRLKENSEVFSFDGDMGSRCAYDLVCALDGKRGKFYTVTLAELYQIFDLFPGEMEMDYDDFSEIWYESETSTKIFGFIPPANWNGDTYDTIIFEPLPAHA